MNVYRSCISLSLLCLYSLSISWNASFPCSRLHEIDSVLACSYYYRYNGDWEDLTDEDRYQRLLDWNSKIGDPKPEEEIADIWNWVIEHHEESREKLRKQYQRKSERKQKREEEDKEENQKQSDYVDALIEEYHIKTLTDTGEMWYYSYGDGIYVPNAEPILKARIESDARAAQEPLSIKGMNETLATIEWRTYFDRKDFNPDIAWLALKNCMVNLMTGEIQPFDSKFMCTTQIPVNHDPKYMIGRSIIPEGYDPNESISGILAFFRLVEGTPMPLSRILEFLYEIMGPKDVDLFLDYLAYCLWREYRFNFWMLLVGAGFHSLDCVVGLLSLTCSKPSIS